MSSIEDARARLDEIARRRNQVIDGASRGRHRGWDIAGMLAVVAGFAALDLAVPSAMDWADVPLRNTIMGVGLVAMIAAVEPAYRALLHRTPA
jgi:hypothetical protein